MTGKKKVHKIIIHFMVAAHEYSNVVGERVSAYDSKNIRRHGKQHLFVYSCAS